MRTSTIRLTTTVDTMGKSEQIIEQIKSMVQTGIESGVFGGTVYTSTTVVKVHETEDLPLGVIDQDIESCVKQVFYDSGECLSPYLLGLDLIEKFPSIMGQMIGQIMVERGLIPSEGWL